MRILVTSQAFIHIYHMCFIKRSETPQAKANPGLNAAILVLAETNDRFDSAVQGTLRLHLNASS
jgi:hypothetical protein